MDTLRTLLLQHLSEADFPVDRREGLVEELVASATLELSGEDSLPTPPPRPEALPGERYTPLRVIGKGGMGEVERVRDESLGRVVVRKLIREELDETARSRFETEARVTGRLQHPAIIPVYESGRLGSGRPWYTMPEVRGRTLREIIREVHEVSGAGVWGPDVDGWTFRRVVDVVRRVAEAVAYAHAQGVLHRDIKPQNIMVGEFGQVFLLDWGLAHIQPGSIAALLEGDAQTAYPGRILGTPSYMPPEQASGDALRIGEPTDVYALGATLYCALAGRPPYRGPVSAVLQALRTRPPEPLSELLSQLHLPPEPELVDLCERCLVADPSTRLQTAAAVARELTDWLDGAWRREQADHAVEQADQLLPESTRLRASAASLRSTAELMLSAVPSWAPAAEKREAWARQDRANAAEREAELAEVAHLQSLHTALELVPDYPAALSRLARWYRAEHARAEALGDRAQAARSAFLLETYDRGEHRTYLAGDGTLSLSCPVPEAVVHLHRYVEQDRRLVPSPIQAPLPLPLEGHPLPMGRYLAVVEAPGHTPVRCPVLVERQSRWTLVPPGAQGPSPIWLPPAGELLDDEVHVPAGWFHHGGDPLAHASFAAGRSWVPDFAMKRHPVTHADFLAFVNDLMAQGRVEEAWAAVPRSQGGVRGSEGLPCYDFGEDGRFHLGTDAEGDTWAPDWPVMLVDWVAARAYCAWRSAQDGLRDRRTAWRLPWELEFEKAARGTDRRTYPYGDHYDPSFSCTRASHGTRPLPRPIHDFPLDESPYGILGLGGNVRTWCLDTWSPDTPSLPEDPGAPESVVPLEDVSEPNQRAPRCIRGGSWFAQPAGARCAYRFSILPTVRFDFVGIRLVRSLSRESRRAAVP